MKKTLTITLLSFLALISKAQDAPKPEFKPSGKFSGQVFGDLQYKVTVPDSANLRTYGSKGQYAFANGYDKSYYSFDLRRLYLGYDYDFSQKFSAQVLFAHEGNLDASGTRTLYIKAANIRWKGIFKGTDLVFGQQGTPVFTTNSEGVWSYRSVEKTLLDMRGIAASNDFGLALQGKYMDGKAGYNFLMGNNNGAKPENDTYKKYYEEIWAKLLDKKLLLSFTTDYEINSLTPNNPGNKHPLKSKMTMKGVVAYQTDKFAIGVEIFSATWKNQAYTKDTATVNPKLNDTVDVKPFGLSVFARATVINKKVDDKNVPVLGVFARYDMYNPDTQYSSAVKYNSGSVNGHIQETFMVFGLDYTPMANLHIMPNIWINSYKENAPLNDTKGKALNKVQGKGSDIDFRITMFWKF